MTSFIKFIVDKKVLTIGIGLIIASQIISISNTLTKNIINPILNSTIKDKKDKLEEFEIELFKIKFKIGEVITAFINLFIVLLFLYYLYRLELNLEKRVN